MIYPLILCNLYLLVYSKVMISLKPNLNLSTFFKNFEGDIKFPLDSSILVSKESNQSFIAIVNKTYNYTLPTFIEAYTEILNYNIEDLVINHSKLFKGSEYSLRENYPKDLITSYPKSLSYLHQKNDNSSCYAEIEYSSPGLKYEYISFNKTKIKFARPFLNLVFGLNQAGELICYQYEKELSLSKIDKYIDGKNNYDPSNEKFENLLIISDESNKKSFLFLKSKSNVYVYSLNIIGNEIKLKEEVRFSNQKLLFIDISHALYKEDYFLIGEKLGSIYIISIKGEIVKKIDYFYSKDDTDPRKLLLISMIRIRNAVYVLSDNYGLKILNISNIANASFHSFDFHHPYLVKLDTHHNPYKDYPFIGVLVSDRYFKDGNEFFFELKVIGSEFTPVLHRYYLDSYYFDLDNFISDDKYSYLYEQNSNSILVLIRSNTITEYNSVYKFQIPILHNVKVTENIFFLKDIITNKDYLAILSDDVLVMIKDLQFNPAYYMIKFLKKGNYSLHLNTLTDYCDKHEAKSRNTDEIFLCDIQMYYSYDVRNEEELNILKLIFSSIYFWLPISLLLLLVITGLIVYCCISIVIPYIKLKIELSEHSKDLNIVMTKDEINNSSLSNTVFRNEVQMATIN